jgi:hypothetical protein
VGGGYVSFGVCKGAITARGRSEVTFRIHHHQHRTMADAQSGIKANKPFYYNHLWKNTLLLFLSINTIPLSAILVFTSLIISKISQKNVQPVAKEKQKQDAIPHKTILITGVSMTKGLTIARVLAQHTSHRIIGADTSSLSPGRFSTSLSEYYRLDAPRGTDAKPYITSLLSVLRNEKVDLWISCSSVVAAVQDGQVARLAQTQAQSLDRVFAAIQFDERVVEKFHEKDQFVEYIASLNLTTPESHRCTSAHEVLNVLRKTKKDRKFILKPIAVNDRARAAMMTLLPFPSASKTTTYVHSLAISPSNPFQLQQYIAGKEYCTHALVIRGRVVAFTSCPSSELLMHYEPLPAHSRLSRAMLAFTETVARDGGEEFTGHLSFDFFVEEGKTGDGDEEMVLFPIECNPRAHTAVVLFEQTPAMADAYLSVFSSSLVSHTPVSPRTPTKSYYWIGHDVVSFGILPLLDLMVGRGSWQGIVNEWTVLARHLAYWKDGTFTLADPWPFFVLYHVYWPARFVESLRTGKAWSRINVSTTKMFDD